MKSYKATPLRGAGNNALLGLIKPPAMPRVAMTKLVLNINNRAKINNDKKINQFSWERFTTEITTYCEGI